MVEGSPLPKLHYSPRPLHQTASAGASFLQGRDVLRAYLAPPSTCTDPSSVEGGGIQGRWRAMGPKDIESMSHATCVANCRRQRPGSKLVRWQAQPQGCERDGQGACSDRLVVPAQHVSPEQMPGIDSPESCDLGSQQSRRLEATCVGYRRIQVQNSIVPFVEQGFWFPGGG